MKKSNEFQEFEKDSVSQKSNTNPIVRGLNRVSQFIDSFGGEIRGIERIDDNERSPTELKPILSVVGLWLSGCGGLTSMTGYFLGPLLFELSLRDCLIYGIIATALGCALASYCATMGPRGGLRQMCSARFIFGRWSVKIVAFVAIIGLLGWSVTNCILGGQILRAISDDKIPLEIGIVIISLVSIFISIFGITHLLRVEGLLSIPVLIGMCLLYGVASPQTTGISQDLPEGMSLDPLDRRGGILSYFTLCFSITSTWGGIASDYYILFPKSVSQKKIFTLTFFGTFLPTIFVAIAGLLIASAALTYEPWNEAYLANGIGGLLTQVFAPWKGGGKFIMVVLFLSLVSNNIINSYSAAFGLQLIGGYIHVIPRWVMNIIVTVVYLVCSLAGRNELGTVLGNFLPMLGYWIAIYFTLLFEENVIFRSTSLFKYYKYEIHPTDGVPKYDFDIWNDFSSLTNGFASTFAFMCGVAGAVLGMAQAYYIGPIAAYFGLHGGDLGMWLSIGFAGAVYPGLRFLELRHFGK